MVGFLRTRLKKERLKIGNQILKLSDSTSILAMWF